DRPRVRRHDVVELHRGEPRGTRRLQRVLAHRVREALAARLRGDDVSGVRDVVAESRLVRPEHVAPCHGTALDGDEGARGRLGPHLPRVLERGLGRRREHVAAGDHRTVDRPDQGELGCVDLADHVDYPTAMAPVQFWFEFASTYSYLAAM